MNRPIVVFFLHLFDTSLFNDAVDTFASLDYGNIPKSIIKRQTHFQKNQTF